MGRRGRCRRRCRRCGGSPPPPARPKPPACWPARSSHVDPAEAERLLRGALDAAVGAGDYRAASAAAGTWSSCCGMPGGSRRRWRRPERKPEYTRRAGLGPWTQLADQGLRLQVLGLMGEHERCWPRSTGTARRGWPGCPPGPAATRPPARGTSARPSWTPAATRRWRSGTGSRRLDLNAEIVASTRQRGAGVHEVTRTRFNDAGPLIRLGRLARRGGCWPSASRSSKTTPTSPALATVLSARAGLESSARAPAGRGGPASGPRCGCCYARPEPQDIAISHHNLAIYLGRLGGDRAGQRAHRLAAALIFRLTGMTHDLGRPRARPGGRAARGATAGLPSTVAEVVAVAELTEGVRLGELLAALEPDPRAVEAPSPRSSALPRRCPRTTASSTWPGTCRAGPRSSTRSMPRPGPAASRRPSLIEFLGRTAGEPDWAAPGRRPATHPGRRTRRGPAPRPRRDRHGHRPRNAGPPRRADVTRGRRSKLAREVPVQGAPGPGRADQPAQPPPC